MQTVTLDDLEPSSKIHIVGIGGIGTSAIAQWLQALGYNVSGSDDKPSSITEWLSSHGIPVTTSAAVLPATDLLIYSDAVPASHQERAYAVQHNIPQWSYAKALGQLTSGYTTIAVAGSHGKSTTTALTGLLLEALGLDPTVVVGTLVDQWRSDTSLGNYRLGKSRLCVVEADEYRSHFLELSPYIGVITSLDHDHIDAFPTPEEYHRAFSLFIKKVKPNGTLVIEENTQPLLEADTAGHAIVTYGRVDSATVKNLVTVSDITWKNGKQEFKLAYQGEKIDEFSLSVSGEHMVHNLAAAVAAAFLVVPDAAKIKQAIKTVTATFHGTWRRFEALGSLYGAAAFSDYAHHPTEVAALIAAAHQQFANQRLVLVFQPHHHSRARAFAQDFIRTLKQGLAPHDQLVLCEVYGVPGREEASEAITARTWAAELPNTEYVRELDELPTILKKHLKPEDVVVFAGAGSIDAYARKLLES